MIWTCAGTSIKDKVFVCHAGYCSSFIVSSHCSPLPFYCSSFTCTSFSATSQFSAPDSQNCKNSPKAHSMATWCKICWSAYIVTFCIVNLGCRVCISFFLFGTKNKWCCMSFVPQRMHAGNFDGACSTFQENPHRSSLLLWRSEPPRRGSPYQILYVWICCSSRNMLFIVFHSSMESPVQIKINGIILEMCTQVNQKWIVTRGGKSYCNYSGNKSTDKPSLITPSKHENRLSTSPFQRQHKHSLLLLPLQSISSIRSLKHFCSLFERTTQAARTGCLSLSWYKFWKFSSCGRIQASEAAGVEAEYTLRSTPTFFSMPRNISRAVPRLLKAQS